MPFVVSKQLGPGGPPDLNRRSIHLYRPDAPTGHRERAILEMAAIDPVLGWSDKEHRVVEAIKRMLKREWPEHAEWSALEEDS